MTKPKIAVILGSDSDLPAMEEGLKLLRDFGVSFEGKISINYYFDKIFIDGIIVIP